MLNPYLVPDGETPSEFEVRFAVDMDLRAMDDATRKMSGYAAVFKAPTKIRSWSGEFTETLLPGCFSETLTKAPDIRMLHEHDYSQLLARTSAKNLILEEDDKGLRFEAGLPDTQLARDVYEQVRVGNLRGMSFGFVPRKWQEERDAQGRLVRVTHEAVDLREITITSMPYYPKTSVALRSLLQPPAPPAGDLVLRARLARLRG